MSGVLNSITAFFMSIVTAISFLPINLVKTITRDDGEKISDGGHYEFVYTKS